MVQKYFKGDLVQLGDMPRSMSHFPANCQAVVMYTYKEKYGGSKREEQQYCLYILEKDQGETSWYDEDQLTLIDKDRFDLLPKGHTDRKVWEAKQQRDNKGE